MKALALQVDIVPHERQRFAASDAGGEREPDGNNFAGFLLVP